MARIATYEYLNTLSSNDMPTTSASIKKCVTAYDFTMNQNYNGYFKDLEYTGPTSTTPPWSLATRDEFRLKQQEQVPYYNIKVTLKESVANYPTSSTVISASVWNAKPSAYSSNGTVVTNVASFRNPRIYLRGGYDGASSGMSPEISFGTSLANFTANTYYDIMGENAPTSHDPSTSFYGAVAVLNSTSTDNEITYVFPTVDVQIAFLYHINQGSTYYITWVPATMTVVTTYR